jgi:hypothetical protein
MTSLLIDDVEPIDGIEFFPFKAEGFFAFLVPDLPSPIVLAKNWTADHLKISGAPLIRRVLCYRRPGIT